MRKWFFLIGLVAVIYLLNVANSRSRREKSPFLQRFKETISILAWSLTTVYILAFLYWLYTVIFK